MTAREPHAPVVPTAPPARAVATATRPVVAVLGCLLLLAGLLLPVPGTTPAAPAHAQPAGDPNQVRLTLEEVTPQPVRPGDQVTLAGTLRNVGTTPVEVDAVRAHTGYQGLDTRPAVRSWAAGGSDVTATRPIGEQELRRRLDPGGRARFRIEVPAGTVDPPFDFANLPLLLDVAGGGEGGTATVGRLRSFLVWDGQQDYDHQPLQVSWLVPLTLPADPDLASTDATVRERAWERAAGEGSRAVRLVRGLSGLGATFLVDPALLAPVAPGELRPVSGQPPQPDPTEPDPTEPDPTEPDPTEPDPTPEVTDPPGATATAGPPPDGAAATATGDVGGGAPGTTSPGADEPPEPPAGPTDDGPDPARGSDAAAPLRSALAGVPESRLWWLPTGDTDLTALREAGVSADLAARLLTRGTPADLGEGPADLGAGVGGSETHADRPPTPGELQERGRDDVLWPVSEALSETALADLRRQWTDATGDQPAGVVVPAGTVDTGHQLTAEASLPAAGAPQLRLLGYEQVLSGLLSEPTAASGVADRQRLLAELLATYQEQPASRRTLLLVTSREDTTDPDRLVEHARAMQRLPWVRLTPGNALLGPSAPQVETPGVLTGQPPPAPAVGDPAGLPPVATSPLRDGGASEVERVRRLLSAAAEIVAGSESGARHWQEVLDQEYSVRWRGSPAWEQPLEGARTAARTVLDGVHVNPTTVNFLADEGLIQVTVVNDLDQPVEGLQVEVTPRNGRLRVVQPTEPVDIGPGSRATVSFRARAVAAGDVPLEVRLTTPGGTEVGEAELMNVHVRPTGAWFYWVLGGLAGAVLLLGVVRTLRSPRQPEQPGDEHPKEAPAP